MKTNTREFKNLIQSHILSFFNPSDYEGLETEVECLACNVNSIMKNNRRMYPTAYSAIKHMVEGGSFEVYYDNVNEFYINEAQFDILRVLKDSHKTWELYMHHLALHGSKMLEKSGLLNH